MQEIVRNAPKGTTHIISGRLGIRYIKVRGEVETWRMTPHMKRQDFSMWSDSDVNIGGWVWLGLITFEKYLKNHKAEILWVADR